jgi:hypothetical protein
MSAPKMLIVILPLFAVSGCIEESLEDELEHDEIRDDLEPMDIDDELDELHRQEGLEGVSLTRLGAEQFLQLSPSEFRPIYHYDTSSTVMSTTIAMPFYIGINGIRPSMAPSPRFPVTMKLAAPVHLPDAVQITSFECYVRDTDDDASYSASSSARLARENPTSDLGRTIALVPMSSGALDGLGIMTSSSLSTTYGLVDNENHQYVAELTLSITDRPSWFGLLFKGCRIGYATVE